jgi:hypothetical protein
MSHNQPSTQQISHNLLKNQPILLNLLKSNQRPNLNLPIFLEMPLMLQEVALLSAIVRAALENHLAFGVPRKIHASKDPGQDLKASYLNEIIVRVSNGRFDFDLKYCNREAMPCEVDVSHLYCLGIGWTHRTLLLGLHHSMLLLQKKEEQIWKLYRI